MIADPKIEGRLFAMELVLSTMLVGAGRAERGFLDRLHSVLSDRLRESASTVAAEHDDVPPASQMAFVEAACNALDSIVSTARAL